MGLVQPAGARLVVPRSSSRRSATPDAPWELREIVEEYARENGRHGRLVCSPHGTWYALFELRANDPAMRAFREGRSKEPPKEAVWFQEEDPEDPRRMIPLDIYALGPSGVRTFLERGNTWGRGEHGSVEEAVEASLASAEAHKEKVREESEQRARQTAKDRRRTLLGIPFLRVGADLESDE